MIENRGIVNCRIEIPTSPFSKFPYLSLPHYHHYLAIIIIMRLIFGLTRVRATDDAAFVRGRCNARYLFAPVENKLWKYPLCYCNAVNEPAHARARVLHRIFQR